MKHKLCVFQMHKLDITANVDKVDVEQHSSKIHHLALLCAEVYSLNTNTLSIYLLFFQIKGCSAGLVAYDKLDVDAMFCMSTQDDGWTSKWRTGSVRSAVHARTRRTNTISCLIAQLMMM